ncbi:MAG: ribulose-phosphate 3-epimerase [Lachnospiraceae bacterium]|nr:ribulose-phosphate 3-epimerase [Lachnospiraceae bacterium]
MSCLSPSILSADFANLERDIRLADEAGAEYIHFDVMDGMFVQNISFGIPVLKSIRKITDCVLDVHLMIEKPERYIHEFAEAGADIITVHAESTNHLDAVIDMIKAEKVMAGVALNPSTPLSEIEYILPKVDMVLIMTVNPGFGGQKFIPYCRDKVSDLYRMLEQKGLKTDIEVDGGITLDNVEEIIEAGANIIVSGSAVFKGDITKNVANFLEII